MTEIQLERLSGGRSPVRIGDTVTPKPGIPDKDLNKWREWTVDKATETLPGGFYLKSPDGKSLLIRDKNLAELCLLTTSSELQALAQLESIREMVAALKAEDDDEAEKAREAIQEDPLSVEVRSRWMELRDWGNKEQGAPAEFKILLCTGGPAVQIIGELNEHADPEKPRLQHQDWGTPWTDVRLSAEDAETLLAYCREFYFGE